MIQLINIYLNIYTNASDVDYQNRLYYINDIIAWNNPKTNKSELFMGVGGAYYKDSEQFPGVYKMGLYKSVDGGITWTWLATSLPAIPGTNREN